MATINIVGMDVLAKKEKGQPIRSLNKEDIRYDRGVETGNREVA